MTDPAVLPELVRRWPTGARRTAQREVDHLVSFVAGGPALGGRTRRFHVVYAAAQRVIRSLELDEALRGLENHLELAVAELSRTRLFVHAGVVGWKGQAIVIPGSSHWGKTTLVEALLAAGAEYYSDEYAILDERGRVHPYPRPLLLRDTSELGRRVEAASLGAAIGRRPLPVGLVAVTRYRHGARWRPAALSPGRSMLELLAHTVLVRSRPERAMNLLGRVVPHARTLKGPRGEAADAARQLLDALERRP